MSMKRSIAVATISALVILLGIKYLGNSETPKEVSGKPVAIPDEVQQPSIDAAVSANPIQVAFSAAKLPRARLDFNDVPKGKVQLEEAVKSPDYGYKLWLLGRQCKKMHGQMENISKDVSNKSLVEACRRVEAAIGDSSKQLIRRAAEAGVVQAQIDYVNYAVFDPDAPDSESFKTENISEEDKKLSMEFLTSAAQAGAVEAMIMLAGVFEAGVLAPRNVVESYAWDYAAHLTGLSNGSDVLLDQRETNMTPEQLVAARTLGNNFYINCCERK